MSIVLEDCDGRAAIRAAADGGLLFSRQADGGDTQHARGSHSPAALKDACTMNRLAEHVVVLTLLAGVASFFIYVIVKSRQGGK